VKALFDTSVIIAALLPKHPSHMPCFLKLQAAELSQIQGCLSTHSLAEIYSVMTRIPSQPRVSPKEAQLLLESCLRFLKVISLEAADYQIAIAQMVACGLPGGAIFDALIAQAAIKASADRLFTLNPGHFTRLNDGIAQITEVPI